MAWAGINLRANLALDKVALFGRSSDLSFGPRLGDQERFRSENSVPEEIRALRCETGSIR